MSSSNESSIPLLSPSDDRFSADEMKDFSIPANPLRRNISVIRVALSGAILLAVAGFIFSMSSLYQGLQIVKDLKAASQGNLPSSPSCPVEEFSAPKPSSHVKPSIPQTFYNFFETIRHPVTSTSYTDVQGNIFETRGDGPWWTEPLGKKVLIVDIDTRLADGKNEIWNNGRLDWEHMENGGNGVLSASQMNHYLYAQFHGYDYRFFRAHDIEGLHSTWVKPHVLYEMLPGYEFVAFLDGDAVVNNLDVPLEWMFNRWGVTNQTHIAVPLDVRQGGATGEDSHGNTEVNTGFLVAQNMPETFELLKAWKDCTNETRYPGCGRWKEEWSHEQRAFSEYIRYDPEFNVYNSSIIQISCDDAMGYPGLGDLGWITDDCRGNFIRHHTINKGQTVRRTELGILQPIIDLARRDLMRNQHAYRIDETQREKEEMAKTMPGIDIIHEGDTRVEDDKEDVENNEDIIEEDSSILPR